MVQKYGGTSVASETSRSQAIAKIIEAKKEYEGVVVVVSAMGRLGDPYGTDTLLSLVDSKNTSLSPREIDLLMSCGEVISSVLMSDLLLRAGQKACAMTGGAAGIITNNTHMNAEVLRVETEHIMNLLGDGFIPVVAGFQGRGMSNEVTTLGRGGSDTSAALLGEALEADLVEIYTDVNGIMTADPRVCPSAKTIDEISYTEVFQMADGGAKVIHPRAVEIARRAGISLVIKNTFNDSEGTNIMSYNKLDKKKLLPDQLITSIAHRKGRIQCLLEGHLEDEVFFQHLAQEDVSIDMINIFPNRRIFTIDEEKKKSALKVFAAYNVEYQTIEDCCKVTVVGERMTGVPGVMAKIIKSLMDVGVEILQTSDSLSTIACLMRSTDLEKAVKALHKTFELD